MTARLVEDGADAKDGGDGGDGGEGTNQHEPGTEAASAKGEYAGTDSGLEADVGISMAAAVEAENKRGRASLSFLGPLITSTARKRAEILAGAWDYGAAQISHRLRFMRHKFEPSD